MTIHSAYSPYVCNVMVSCVSAVIYVLCSPGDVAAAFEKLVIAEEEGEGGEAEGQSKEVGVEASGGSSPTATITSTSNGPTSTPIGTATTATTAGTAGEDGDGTASTMASKQSKISRRRRTTSADFDRALKDLRQNSQELDKMCQQASRLTELSRKSVDAFKDALLMNISGGSRTFDKTTPLGMFKWVAQRVILQNTVQRVRDDLNAREHSKGIHINATFPNPDGSIGNRQPPSTAQMNRVPHLAALAESHEQGTPFSSPRSTQDDVKISTKRADRMAATTNKTLQKSQSGPSHLPPVNGTPKR